MRERAATVGRELLAGDIIVEPGKAQLLETRKAVERGWMSLADDIAANGYHDLAARVQAFVAGMPTPRSEKERIAESLCRMSKPANHDKGTEPMTKKVGRQRVLQLHHG